MHGFKIMFPAKENLREEGQRSGEDFGDFLLSVNEDRILQLGTDDLSINFINHGN